MTSRLGQRLYDAIRQIRPIHQASAKIITDALADQQLTMPMRAVLEQVHDRGPSTVPQLARRLWVTRQGAQQVVDSAIALGYLVSRSNPGHRRSHLIELTQAGRAAYRRVHADELRTLDRIAADLDPADIDACIRVLTHLSDQLQLELDNS